MNFKKGKIKADKPEYKRETSINSLLKNLEFVALILGIISSILGIITYIQTRKKNYN